MKTSQNQISQFTLDRTENGCQHQCEFCNEKFSQIQHSFTQQQNSEELQTLKLELLRIQQMYEKSQAECSHLVNIIKSQQKHIQDLNDNAESILRMKKQNLIPVQKEECLDNSFNIQDFSIKNIDQFQQEIEEGSVQDDCFKSEFEFEKQKLDLLSQSQDLKSNHMKDQSSSNQKKSLEDQQAQLAKQIMDFEGSSKEMSNLKRTYDKLSLQLQKIDMTLP